MLRIEHGRGKLYVAEQGQPDEAFVCVSIDGSGCAMFLTADQCMAAAGEIMAIARQIRKRRRDYEAGIGG